MAVTNATLNPSKSGRLCAKVLPKAIANDEEFDRMEEQLEELCMKAKSGAEERALADLLTKPINDYDDLPYSIPQSPPHRMLA